MAEISQRRNGELARAALSLLSTEENGMPVRDLLKKLEVLVEPTAYESADWPNYPGVRRYEKVVRFATIETVKAGWLVKAAGTWTITDSGRDALDAFSDPLGFQREAARLYREWKKQQARREKLSQADVSGASAAAASGGPTQVSAGGLELFHRINRLLPEGQELVSVPPDATTAEALELMLAHNYSQLPVVAEGYVLGAFTLRSFARGILDMRAERVNPLDLPVDEYVETLTMVHLTAELETVLQPLDMDGAVLVGRPDSLDGVVTGVDALQYLYQIAQLFVQLQEIEQALRSVITRSVTPSELITCIRRSLIKAYKGRENKLPVTVLDMTFGEYASVIGDRRNWSKFEPILGTDRNRVIARLERTAELRNDVLHFRRELESDDRRQLLATREWLVRRIHLAEHTAVAADV